MDPDLRWLATDAGGPVAEQMSPSGFWLRLDLRKRVRSAIPGEARQAQQVLVVSDGTMRLTCGNVIVGLGARRPLTTLLPRFCHASGGSTQGRTGMMRSCSS